ncbi:hypothetical protein TNCV_4299701 [Trichonephila clavipes]|nr:hypothetical protein TNCV_4299701 [Trichonephila clavipes]
MLGDQPFASRSRYANGGNVCSGYVNISTGCAINGGLLSSQTSPGLTSKSTVGVFSLGENLELGFIHDTFVKEMHTDQAVSVLGVVSLWLDAQISMSFPVEILMFIPIEMTSWILLCALMPGLIGDASVLQDDNARTHIVEAYLEQETI